MSHSSSVGGFTLVELMVSLVVLAIALGVVTGQIASTFVAAPDPADWTVRAREAEREAVESGNSVVIWPDSSHLEPLLFLPDGRMVGSFAGEGS